MQFLFQPLIYGFLLAAVPIIVHLINLLRHRKQSWAAMDFLLESYRKNRRWVLLKQWLLLAARILIMLVLVAMLARWISNSQWLSILGGRTTHHYVLLDDSYSMAEQEQNESAYQRGLRAFAALVRAIAEQPGQHQISLLRFSRAELAARSGKESARIDAAADLISQTIPRDPSRLLERVNASQPSSLQLSPETSVDLILPLLEQQPGEQAQVYVVSDFRRNEWNQPEVLRNKLSQLRGMNAEIQLIDCGEGNRSNLTLAQLEPQQEVLATGVPLMVRLQVRNPSAQVVRNVVVRVRTVQYAQGQTVPASEQAYSGQVSDLPPLVIEQIGPNEAVSRQVQVVFNVPGEHVVEAVLPDDALHPDNRRWCVVRIQQALRVLQIDGDLNQANAFFLSTALNPDGRGNTGMSIESRDTAYLRDVKEEELRTWDAIALLDVPRLDKQAVEKLESFCRQGGGVFLWAGPNSNVNQLNNELYRAGEGLFPVPVEGVADVPRPDGEAEPQVAASEHFILAPLRGLSSSPFPLVQIRQILQIPADFDRVKAGVELVAMAGRHPLVVDKQIGDGHVVAILTGVDSTWSNWAQDPTFVVMALRTIGYLGSFRRELASQMVATSIQATFAGQNVLPDGEVLLPSLSGPRMRLQHQAEQSADGQVANLNLGIDVTRQAPEVVDALLRPGIFETWLPTTAGKSVVRNLAHNVAAAEGDLGRMTSQELEEKLRPVNFRYRSAASLNATSLAVQTSSHSTLLMIILAGLLLCEQILGYAASFHPPPLATGGSK